MLYKQRKIPMFGKRISKSFERPEGTQKDVAALDKRGKSVSSFP